jgi:hypothetical protein
MTTPITDEAPPDLLFGHATKAVNAFQVLDAANGIVQAIVNVTGWKDAGGDTSMPGCFKPYLKDPKPKICFAHSWSAMAGKVLENDELMPGDSGIKELAPDLYDAGFGGLYSKHQFNLDTQVGRETFSNVQFYGPEGEWSIGYTVLDAEPDETGGMKLKAVPCWEYSFVLFGMNELTRTLGAKMAAAVVADQKAMEQLAKMFFVRGLRSSKDLQTLDTGGVPIVGQTVTDPVTPKTAEPEPAPVESETKEPVVEPKTKDYDDLPDGLVEGSWEDLEGDLVDLLYEIYPDAWYISTLATIPADQSPGTCAYVVWPWAWDEEPVVAQVGYSIGDDMEPMLSGDPISVSFMTSISEGDPDASDDVSGSGGGGSMADSDSDFAMSAKKWWEERGSKIHAVRGIVAKAREENGGLVDVIELAKAGASVPQTHIAMVIDSKGGKRRKAQYDPELDPRLALLKSLAQEV